MSEAPYVKGQSQAAPTNESHEANGIRVGAWGADLCGCFTHFVPNCCMATFLPFISIAQIAQRMNVARYGFVMITFLVLYLLEIAFGVLSFIAALDSYQNQVDSINSGNYYYSSTVTLNSSTSTAIVSSSVANAVQTIVGVIYLIAVWQLRSKIRERFQIPGSCCEDYCCVWWCSCCVIAQMATHVKSYTPGSCDFGPPDTLPAYE